MSSSNRLTLYIGIASREAIKRRTIAIAKGEWHPAENEPRVLVLVAGIARQGSFGKEYAPLGYHTPRAAKILCISIENVRQSRLEFFENPT